MAQARCHSTEGKPLIGTGLRRLRDNAGMSLAIDAVQDQPAALPSGLTWANRYAALGQIGRAHV
jgi:hypothetical protein